MADDDTTFGDGYEPPPYVPSTGTTAEPEQGGNRAPESPPPAPRPGPIGPLPPRHPAPPVVPPPLPMAKPGMIAPARVAIVLVVLGGLAYGGYELLKSKHGRGR